MLASVAGLMLAACGSGSKVARSPDDGRGRYQVGKPYTINGVTYSPSEDWNYNQIGTASWYGPGFHGKSTANGETYDQNQVSAAHKTLPLPSIVRVTNLDNGRSTIVRVNDRGPFVEGRIIDMSRAGAHELGFDMIGTARVRVEVMRRESEIVKQIALGGGGRDEQMAAIANGRRNQPMIASAPPPSPPPADQAVPAAPPSPPPPVVIVAPPPPAPAAIPPIARAPAPPPVVQPAPPNSSSIYVQAGAFSQLENATRLSQQLSRMGTTQVTPVNIAGREIYRVRIGPLASREQGDQLLVQLIQSGHRDAKLIVE